MMKMDATNESPATDPNEVRRTRVVMCLVAAAFAATFLTTLQRVPANPAEAPPPDLVTGIDPNTADWYELAQLPGIGETVARRIVEHRVKRLSAIAGSSSGSQDASHAVIYRQPGDLARVSGIGPRSVRRIAPYLRFAMPRPVDATPSVDKPGPGK